MGHLSTHVLDTAGGCPAQPGGRSRKSPPSLPKVRGLTTAKLLKYASSRATE